MTDIHVKQDREGLPDSIIEERRFFELYGYGKTDTPAGWNNPENWKEIEEIPEGRPFGFAIGNNSNYLFIDFDHMRRGKDNVQWMIDVYNRLMGTAKTYFEVSMSETGLHMIADLGDYADYFEPENNSYDRIIVAMDPKEYEQLSKEERDKIPKVEFWYHTNGRYVYLTGKHKELIQVAKDEEAAALFRELLKIRDEFHHKYSRTETVQGTGTDPERPRFEIDEATREKVLKALQHISANCSREEWIHVGIALHNCGFPFEVWDRWSQYADMRTKTPCDKYDPKETPKIWKSFKGGKSNWNAGTIISRAKENGYIGEIMKPEAAATRRERKTLEPDDRTDIGQAAVFRDVYGEKVRYSKATDFLIYDGVKWCEDSIHAQKLAQELTDRQLREARKRCTATNKALLQAKESEDEDRIKAAMEADNAAKSYFSYVLGRRKNSSINNTLSQVRSMVQIRVEDLDADPYLLNTPGGAVDLRTGKIRKNRPEDYCTKATAVCPSAEGADLFSQFMETVTDGDQDLIQYLQIVAGMCAVGMVKQEKLIIAYGEGGTGKSTFFNLLFSLFGDYSGMLSAETLTTGQRDNKKPELAELRGKRLIIAAELEEGTRMNTAMVKKLCSTDPIHAAKKFKDEFEFIPSHTVILYTNHLPKVGTSDTGTWRRLTVVPFQHKFSDTSGEIKNYAEYLLSHAGGAVLSWVIEGATRFIRDHYKIEEPGCVRRAIDSYREENDWLGHFIEECCEIGNSYEAPAGPLYDRYRRFCEDSGEYIRNMRDFKNAMERAGYEHKRGTGGKRLYIGIQQKCHFEPIPAGIKTPFEEGA